MSIFSCNLFEEEKLKREEKKKERSVERIVEVNSEFNSRDYIRNILNYKMKYTISSMHAHLLPSSVYLCTGDFTLPHSLIQSCRSCYKEVTFYLTIKESTTHCSEEQFFCMHARQIRRNGTFYR